MRHITDGLLFLTAALLAVGDGATVREGLRGRGKSFVAAGCLLLAIYGIVVNTVRLDFSRRLGLYVAAFAVASALIGKLFFGERIALSTWLGLAIIVIGGLLIQFSAIGGG